MPKACKNCGASKALAEFHICRAARDGHKPVCKDCRRTGRAATYVPRSKTRGVATIQEGKKPCISCHRLLDLGHFSPKINGPGGRRSRCKECRSAADRKRYAGDSVYASHQRAAAERWRRKSLFHVARMVRLRRDAKGLAQFRVYALKHLLPKQ